MMWILTQVVPLEVEESTVLGLYFDKTGVYVPYSDWPNEGFGVVRVGSNTMVTSGYCVTIGGVAEFLCMGTLLWE